MFNKYKNICSLDMVLLSAKYSGKELDEVIAKIENDDYPVQYAIGNVEFLEQKIIVDDRVLIPRFATELLVCKTIEYIDKYGLSLSRGIDICTGSGCIAVALAAKFTHAKIEACDISRDALEVLKENIELNNVDIDFYIEDVLKVNSLKNKYSLIISNPPYVRDDEYVSPNTRYEPELALYPGEDDIIFYKKIIDLGKDSLLEHGLIAFEIGSTQGKRIEEYARNAFFDAEISIEKDFEGFDRFLFIIK